MHAKRRTAVKTLSLLGVSSCWGLGASAAAWPFNDKVKVVIKVRDIEGNPIPYVGVWSFMETLPAHEKNAAWPAAHLKADDLWRVTQRYGALHEIISKFGDKPVPYLGVSVMANAEGVFNDEVSYQETTGERNHFPRPDPLTFGYTFMKRGYEPTKADFVIPKSQNTVDAVVTLQRNPNESPESAPYHRTFARVRYEWSNALGNMHMTMENHWRLEGLRLQLEQAAQQAIAVGDKPAAARMYARMRYVPHLILKDGRIIGYSQGDADSDQAKRAVDLAYELDPNSLYIWMKTISRRLKHPHDADMEQRIRSRLIELEKLIQAFGLSVWPEIYQSRATSHALLGEYKTAHRLYLEAAQIEPKYYDWKETINDMKAQMKRKGVPVPFN